MMHDSNNIIVSFHDGKYVKYDVDSIGNSINKQFDRECFVDTSAGEVPQSPKIGVEMLPKSPQAEKIIQKVEQEKTNSSNKKPTTLSPRTQQRLDKRGPMLSPTNYEISIPKSETPLRNQF